MSQTILARSVPLAAGALIVPHSRFTSTFFFLFSPPPLFLFYPACFPSPSYCSSDVACTQLPGFPLSEAKDSTPAPCQDTLSVPGSLQTGWSGEGGGGGGGGEGWLAGQGKGCRMSRGCGGSWGHKYKKRPDGGGFIGKEKHKRAGSQG